MTDQPVTPDPSLRDTLRKYPSFGSAVKANDVEAVQIMDRNLPKALQTDDMASILLWSGSPQMTPEMAAFLVSRDANPRFISIEDGQRNGISVPFKAAVHGNARLVAWFLDQKLIDPNAVDNSGQSLLCRALKVGATDVADVLAARGADPNRVDLRGCSAFHYAAAEYQVASLVWLMQHGADPTLETAEDGAIAAETLPDKASLGEVWDPDALYECLENYREEFLTRRNAAPGSWSFPIPPKVLDEVALERGPGAPPAPASAPDPAPGGRSRPKC